MERERMEQKRREQEKIKQQRIEEKRIEQERIEKERQEQEKIKQQRIQKSKKKQKEEKISIEKEQKKNSRDGRDGRDGEPGKRGEDGQKGRDAVGSRIKNRTSEINKFPIPTESKSDINNSKKNKNSKIEEPKSDSDDEVRYIKFNGRIYKVSKNLLDKHKNKNRKKTRKKIRNKIKKQSLQTNENLQIISEPNESYEILLKSRKFFDKKLIKSKKIKLLTTEKWFNENKYLFKLEDKKTHRKNFYIGIVENSKKPGMIKKMIQSEHLRDVLLVIKFRDALSKTASVQSRTDALGAEKVQIRLTELQNCENK
jgi:hypothetical protein